MEYDKSFLREYSLDVARLKDGKSEASYEVEGKFFERFDKSQIKEGEARVDISLEKTPSHLDAHFTLGGWVYLECDRCRQPYKQELENHFHIVYSFKEKEKASEDTEVIYIDKNEEELSLIQEIYDFIHLSLPMRKVPDPSVHLCDPKVLEVLGLDEEGKPVENVETEEEIDPRWAALKQLKDKME